jgi:N-hydroxyarylamine O-acetyltransferase
MNTTFRDAAEWCSEELDVDAYFARVGYGGPTEATADVLRGLHRAHVISIPFENLDIVMGREVSVEIASIQEKLLLRRRGGYYFEHNLLFAALLERLGFSVTWLSARVRMGNARILPSTHMTLNVSVNGRLWLADVGFGGEGLLEPVSLDVGVTSEQGARAYGLVRETDREWVLRTSRPDGWLGLYSFTLEPCRHADYFVANYYTSTHPRSPFTGRMVTQRVEPNRRLSLIDHTLVESDSSGEATSRTVSDAELGELLQRFGIVLDPKELDHLRPPRPNCPSEA